MARTKVQSTGGVAPPPAPARAAAARPAPRADAPTLSIVVAAYNEEDVLDLFFARLGETLAKLGESY